MTTPPSDSHTTTSSAASSSGRVQRWARRPRRTSLSVVLAAGIGVITIASLTVGPDSGDTELTGAVAGKALDQAANPSPEEIADFLQHDEYDLDGPLLRVSDPPLYGPTPSELHAEQSKQTDDSSPQNAISESAALSLHTRPSSTRKIFLDFDGHVTQDTPWNSTSDTIVSTPYSRGDGVANSTFSQYELDSVVEIWTQVAEDFSMWDVDVTTEDPGVAGLSKSNSLDETYGVRVVITDDSSWYGPYGGAAYLFSYDRSYDLPAFVFSGNLADGRAKSVGEAAAHEAGHTFGLHHDAIRKPDGTDTGYYAGHGDWAPIMGVGYYRSVTQWSKGEYDNASNDEDDVAEIDRYLVRLADTSSSSTLGGDSTTRHTLVDGGGTSAIPLFVDAGPVQIDIVPANADGNLLADLTVRDPSGAPIATDTPTTPSDWSLSATLPAGAVAGTYTIEVRSIGFGTASNGFSDYASAGDFIVSIDAPDGSDTTTSTTEPGTETTEPPTTEPGTETTEPPTTGSSLPPTGPTTEPPTTAVPRPPALDGDDLGDRLTAISPQRLLDTRRSDALFDRLDGGEQIRLDPLAIDGVDPTASAVVVNLVAVNPSATGFLSVTPCTGSSPDTSSLNYVSGRNVSNSVIAPLSDDGFICVDASTSTDVIVDVTGWLGSTGDSALGSIEAMRVVDTRAGTESQRLAADLRYVISLVDLLGPSTDAVSINVTAVNPLDAGFLTIDDCRRNGSDTTTSSLNFARRETRGNNGTFALGTDQTLCLTTSADTHLTIDVTGQFAAGDGLTFIPAQPTRLLDTRETERLGAGGTTRFDVPAPTSSDGSSATPSAASINLAGARHVDGGHVTAWDCGARPETSALNTVTRTPTANSALVPVATGHTCLYHAAGGDLIVDLTGWWV